jgi:transposase
VRRKLVSHDPQRKAILAHIRRTFRTLPEDGVLVFFDVKPVTVKAYGGHRFSATPLILERNQKTRGRFYLFALYDVKAGRVRWRYYQGKNSEFVCRFMRQVRRWYPQQTVWVVLDQDGAHPCKSKTTKRTMRELHLHWISLPKGSPDDNPCETLFSIIQLLILDNSNDPDARTLRRRISGKFRQRNRRTDRFIAIPYL